MVSIVAMEGALVSWFLHKQVEMEREGLRRGEGRGVDYIKTRTSKINKTKQNSKLKTKQKEHRHFPTPKHRPIVDCRFAFCFILHVGGL